MHIGNPPNYPLIPALIAVVLGLTPDHPFNEIENQPCPPGHSKRDR
jgi:hypothetical protein